MRVTRLQSHRCLAAAAALAGLALASMASGQPVNNRVTPTGAGRALDRPLDRPLDAVPGQFSQPRRSLADEIRFRNAIVTGNAPNGMSFRGDVGYTAPFEFRGELSTDDNFAFRRDAFFGGLAGQGIRGTDALQYQMALTTGSAVPPGLAGSLSFNRPGGAGSASSLSSMGFGNVRPDFNSGFDAGAAPIRNSTPDVSLPGPGEALSVRTNRLDVAAASLPTLRSTAAFHSVRTLRPELLGYSDGGRDRLVASGLSGVQLQQDEDFDQPDRPDNRFGIRSPVARASAAARPSLAVNGSAYEQIVRRLELDAATTSPNATPDANNPSAIDPSNPAPNAGGQDGGASGVSAAPWQQRINELRQQMTDLERQPSVGVPATVPDRGGDAPVEDDGRVRYRYDPETMRMIRDSGGRITELAPLGTERDAYTEHMSAGSTLLATERYFDAEERFTRALAVRSGDVSARVGRVHAQIGAGLFLSAGVNLRRLLAEHPEIAGARYDKALMPTPERLGQTVIVLRETLSRGGDLGREAALLLAYVGFQAGQVGIVQEGLAAMRADRVTDSRGREVRKSPDPLAGLLEEIWLPLLERAMESGALPAGGAGGP